MPSNTVHPPSEARTPLRRRWWFRLARLALVIYAVWLGALYALQEKLIFPRDMTGPPTQERLIPASVERLWVGAFSERSARPGPGQPPTPESKTEAWFSPAPGASAQAPAPAAIFFHGNAELIDHQEGLVERYHARGISVMLCEFRGYGRSGGRPGQDAIVEDARAFYDMLVARPDVDRARIIIHGRSLGSGVAAQLAGLVSASDPKSPAALILESPFTSIAALAWRHGVPPIFLKHPFHTDRVLPRLTCPILILHSRDDEIIPFAHGQKLHKLVPTSDFVELSGGHNSALSEHEEYWAAIDDILGRTRPWLTRPVTPRGPH